MDRGRTFVKASGDGPNVLAEIVEFIRDRGMDYGLDDAQLEMLVGLAIGAWWQHRLFDGGVIPGSGKSPFPIPDLSVHVFVEDVPGGSEDDHVAKLLVQTPCKVTEVAEFRLARPSIQL